MADIVCLGEALIDLVPTVTGGGSGAGADTYVRAAGGAPANVAAGIAKLGVTSGFMGSVGDDGSVIFIADTLAAGRRRVAGVALHEAAADGAGRRFVKADGDREFVSMATRLRTRCWRPRRSTKV